MLIGHWSAVQTSDILIHNPDDASSWGDQAAVHGELGFQVWRDFARIYRDQNPIEWFAARYPQQMRIGTFNVGPMPVVGRKIRSPLFDQLWDDLDPNYRPSWAG